jgi:Icc-related predicted phosphoesterase
LALAFFTSDLHGRSGRYRALCEAVVRERPGAVFLGGDLLPHGMDHTWNTGRSSASFVTGFMTPEFAELRRILGPAAPAVFLILGNDDPFSCVAEILAGQERGLWTYVHRRRAIWEGFEIYGYNCVPPTPFLLKDWERYDISRYVPPGCLSPEEGRRSDGLTAREIRWTTIAEELAGLLEGSEPDRSILLLHSPPHETKLDRAALDGRTVDHVPLDLHVGSIAIRSRIEQAPPLLTLHGHIHESARLTGDWRDRLGPTHAFTGAHHGPELALVRFDPHAPGSATRELIPA